MDRNEKKIKYFDCFVHDLFVYHFVMCLLIWPVHCKYCIKIPEVLVWKKITNFFLNLLFLRIYCKCSLQYSMEYLENMEFNFLFFKVMNRMKFGVAVWESIDFWEFCGDFFRAVLNFCMPVYYSCNLIKSLAEICWNWLNFNIQIAGIHQSESYLEYSSIFIK